jgi:hypothetical protein
MKLADVTFWHLAIVPESLLQSYVIQFTQRS